MNAFTIPTIFTGVDKLSAIIKKMRNNTDGFANKLEGGLNRTDRAFKKLMPGLSDTGKQMLSFASSAAIAGGILATGKYSVDAIMDYENALQSFRTIVSELSTNDFKKFENKIIEVAKTTGKSSVDVALAFEKIAGLNADFAKTADGLGTVSQAAITLSQASRDDLGKSAENLVGILNQFSLGAGEANRVINVLAAGQAVGASSITQTADAFTVFGAVAKESNLSLEQSVALTEVLASKQIMGAEAGTALRGTLIRLKASGYGYASGLFNTKDALEEVNKKYNKLRTAKEKDALLDKTFGTINMTTGTILLKNIETYGKFTDSVTNTSEASKAAAINQSTLSEGLKNLSNAWVNMLTGSNGANTSLNKVKKAVAFLTNNLSEIIDVAITAGKVFLGFKAIMLAGRIALIGYNTVMVISSLVTGTLTASTSANVVAMNISSVATKTATAAQWLWNVALTANPIGLVIMGVAALTAGLIYHNKILNETIELQQKAFKTGAKTEVAKVKNMVDKKGFTKQEAITKEKNDIAFEMKMNERDIKDATNIFGVISDKDKAKKLVEQKTNLIGRKQAVDALEQNKLDLNGNKIERSFVIPNLENKPFEDNVPSSKVAQAQMFNTTNTNNAKVLVEVKSDTETKTTTNNPFVTIKSQSTQPAY